ncbi:MAG: type I-C CRISPR-associated protein Cas7/Csd2 [Candidatus Brocadiaceae bacterium]|nr:type I-C CRISPR-associated protein Cas7/Csd2 [Candidatus Brocadiaceae bacterium]
MSEPISKRYDFVLLFDVRNGNPNGDPDAGNAPRIDPETGHGIVTDVCLKRKIRNYICLAKGCSEGHPEPGYDIYVKEGAILNKQHERAYEAPGVKDADKGAERIELARQWMCQTFFDIRMFGAVMTTSTNCGQVRGPVQLAFARSIDPIAQLEQSITRMAVTTEREAQAQSERQEGQARTMGRKAIVPYGLYEVHGFISPHFAAKTGFSEEDLQLLWQALLNMFEHDRSSARGEMATRQLIVFEHESALGNAPAHSLFARVHAEKRDATRPARAFGDYDVTIDGGDLPTGITMHKML